MFRFARAAAYAVASLIVAASATYAGPSLAWEVEVPTEAPSTLWDHSQATPVPAGADAAPAAQTGYDPNFTPAIAEHAVAPLRSDVPEAADEARERPLSALVDAYASTSVSDSELECLAGAVYFESKGEPLEGQLAVAEVILNRAGSGRYPGTVCGVVKQKNQFSFVRGGRIPPIARDSAAWRRAVAIAHIAKKELDETGIGNAMFFHARYVSPGWRRLTRVASIGNHIFYR